MILVIANSILNTSNRYASIAKTNENKKSIQSITLSIKKPYSSNMRVSKGA